MLLAFLRKMMSVLEVQDEQVALLRPEDAPVARGDGEADLRVKGLLNLSQIFVFESSCF